MQSACDNVWTPLSISVYEDLNKSYCDCEYDHIYVCDQSLIIKSDKIKKKKDCSQNSSKKGFDIIKGYQIDILSKVEIATNALQTNLNNKLKTERRPNLFKTIIIWRKKNQFTKAKTDSTFLKF